MKIFNNELILDIEVINSKISLQEIILKKNKTGKSVIWQNFSILFDKFHSKYLFGYSICNVCKKLFKYKSINDKNLILKNGTSSMSNHLNNCVNQNIKNINITKFIKKNCLVLNENEKKLFNENIVDFIASTNSSLNIINNKNFQNLIYKSIIIGQNNYEKNCFDFIKLNFMSKYQLRKFIIDRSILIKNNLKLKLEKNIKNKSISLVTDIWQCKFTNVSYLNLICSTINNDDFKLKHIY